MHLVLDNMKFAGSFISHFQNAQVLGGGGVRVAWVFPATII